MKRIGIFGGTFNPIHLGHLYAAQAAQEAFGLDRVLLVPCQVSPFKRGATGQASAADRLEMVRLSVAGDARLEPSDIDLRRGGVSFAIDTVAETQRLFPQARVCFIVGMDALRELHHWHRVDEMLKVCDVITLARPGVDLPLTAGELPFPDAVRERLLQNIRSGRACDISSSEIRRRIAEGRPIRYLVRPEVEAYIRSRGLYADRVEE